ncbi:MAG TPA: hypothetical protein VFV35_03385, partial [Acidimicrobiales bacterium]|nr:hypothetical protein [Acidimicrobiales bacterium]
MERPVVVVAADIEVASALARDFRWPMLADPGHAAVLVEQGFSCVVSCDVSGLDECHVVEIEMGLDVGGAHQHIASMSHLDPLRLNADVGTFAWVSDDEGQVLL